MSIRLDVEIQERNRYIFAFNNREIEGFMLNGSVIAFQYLRYKIRKHQNTL